MTTNEHQMTFFFSKTKSCVGMMDALITDIFFWNVVVLHLTMRSSVDAVKNQIVIGF